MISILDNIINKLSILFSNNKEEMALNIKRPSSKTRVNFSYRELWLRIGFTGFVILLYRFGSHVTVPGLNAPVLSHLVEKSAGGLLSMLNTLAGGSVERGSIFILSLSTYIQASIMIQILSFIYEPLQALKKEGESGQKKKNQYTRYLALVITLIWSYGTAVALERQSLNGMPAVLLPGLFFRFSTMVSITAGTFFLIWISEQINERGIGQGTSIIIYTGIVAQLPVSIKKITGYLNTGLMSMGQLAFDIILLLTLMLLASFIEQSYRGIQVTYPRGQLHVANNINVPTEIPVKLNVAGLLAPMMAQTLLSLPKTLASFFPSLAEYSLTGIFHIIALSILIFCLAFVTAPLSLDPEDTSKDLQKNNGFITGIKSGSDTVAFFEYLLNRLAIISGLYLVIMCVLPELYLKQSGMPVLISGTGILIVIGTTYEMLNQISGYRLTAEYEKLFKKYTKRQ